MALNFRITADNEDFKRKLAESRQAIIDSGNAAEREGHKIEQMFRRMTGGLATLAVGASLKEFVSNIANVRGEFQKLEVAFNTMVGAEKATKLMQQLVKTAATTPFDLQGVANGAKQLLAYGESAEKVNENLVRLGNIASGLTIPLNDLVYLYGTTMTQGRLYTTDFNQFLGRGIPLAKELAKQFEVSEEDVRGLVEAGKVGFPQVQKAIESLTNEGGMFFNLMQEQSKTIPGQLVNIGDAIDVIFNNLGKSSEGAINTVLSGVTYLVENYEKVGRVILELVVTYGAYKAVLIIINALQALNTKILRQAVLEKKLAAAANITLSNSQAIAAARTKAFAIAQGALLKSLKATAAALVPNPYVLAAAAVAGLAFGIYKLATHQTEAEKAQRRLNGAINEAEKSSMAETRELARLKGQLSATTIGSEEYNRIKETIVKNYGKYNQGLADEIEKVGLLDSTYKSLTASIKASFSVRQYEKFMQSEFDNLDEIMSENLGKIQDRLIKRLGDEAGAKYYEKIRQAIFDGNLSIQQFVVTEGLDNETKAALDEVAGKEDGWLDITNRAVEGCIQNILSAQQLVDELDEKAKKRFGINETSTPSASNESSEVKEFDDVNQKIKETTTSLVKYKQELADLRSGKTQVEKDKLKSTIESKEKELQEAEKLLETLTGKKTTQVESSSFGKIREDNEKLKLLTEKNALELAQSEKDAQFSIEQAKIDERADGADKMLAQRELNHRKELDAIKREAEDKKRKMIEMARSEFEADPKSAKKSFDANAFAQSEPAKKQFAIVDKERQAKTNASNAIYSREDPFNDVLKAHQDYADKRLEIEKKYNDDIALLEEGRKKAQESGDQEKVDQFTRSIAQATKSKGKELMGLDYEKLKESPEYIRAFENLKQTSSETLNSLLSQFEKAKHTAAEVLSPEQLREYTTTIQEIMDELDSRNPFQSLIDKKQELADAQVELVNAQIALQNAQQNVDTIKAGGKVEVTGTKYNQKTGKIESTKSYLSESKALEIVRVRTEKYLAAKCKVVETDSKVKKAEKDVTQQIDKLSDAMNELGASIGGPAGEIITLIGDIGNFALVAMNGVKMAADTSAQAISTVEKASVILMIISMAIQLATKVASMFKDDDGVAEYERAKDVYKSYIDILDKVIDKQRELFELNSKTGEQAYEIAVKTVKKQESASRDLGKQYLNSGASKGFLGMGSSASEGVKQREAISSNAWYQAKKVLGADFYNKDIGNGRMEGLFDLTVKQLEDLQKDAPLFWAELNSDTQDYLQKIIDCNEELAKLENDRKEGLTKADFDSFYSSFLDTLNDMDASSEDFANSFEDYLKNAILSSLIASEYKDEIKTLYDNWAAFTKSDEELTDTEVEALRKEQKAISEGLLKKREELAKIFDWDSEEASQESTKRGFETMTQDQAGELNGRFTAFQMTSEEIKLHTGVIMMDVSELRRIGLMNVETLLDMRDLGFDVVFYLEKITKNTDVLHTLNELLEKIEKNTR